MTENAAAGMEWTVRDWYTTTDGDRVALLTFESVAHAVLYSYEWPASPQMIEHACQEDAVTAYMCGLESAVRKGTRAQGGALVPEPAEA